MDLRRVGFARRTSEPHLPRTHGGRGPARRAAAALLLAAALAGTGTLAAEPTFWDDLPAPALVERLVGAMSDADLLAQVFLIGYVDRNGGPSESVLQWAGERGVGGVKVFPRNVTSLEQIVGVVADLQTRAMKGRFGIPLFVATDQEGGWIRHIKHGTSATPGNLAIGASGLPEDAYRTGSLLGQELRALGINMNFAPTIDVYSNPRAEVIGPRAFSSDPVTTGLLGLAYFRGLDDAGIISTAKHFPGHGDADGDSHGSLPVIPVDMETLWERDLVPYRFLVREGLPAIMSGHLSFPRILGNDTPSSLSPIMMVDLLRNRLGFQGIAVTDDLEMEGVLRGKIDMSVASRMALEAGNDVILLSHVPEAQEQAWSALLARMRVPTFRARVLEAVGRILRVKLEYFRGTRSFPLVPDPKTATRGVPAAGSGSFWFDQAARSVTALRGRNLPYRPQPGERILIVSPYGEFLEAGRLRYPGAVTSHLGNGTDLLRDTAEPERRYDTIIYHLCATQVDHTTLSVLRRLKSYRGTLIVVSSFSPAYLDEVPWVTTALAVYGDTRDSYRAAFGALAGDFVPAGKLPVGFMRL